MQLAHLVYRLATDQALIRALHENADQVLEDLGRQVEPTDLLALMTVLRQQADWQDLCRNDWEPETAGIDWEGGISYRAMRSSTS